MKQEHAYLIVLAELFSQVNCMWTCFLHGIVWPLLSLGIFFPVNAECAALGVGHFTFFFTVVCNVICLKDNFHYNVAREMLLCDSLVISWTDLMKHRNKMWSRRHKGETVANGFVTKHLLEHHHRYCSKCLMPRCIAIIQQFLQKIQRKAWDG